MVLIGTWGGSVTWQSTLKVSGDSSLYTIFKWIEIICIAFPWLWWYCDGLKGHCYKLFILLLPNCIPLLCMLNILEYGFNFTMIFAYKFWNPLFTFRLSILRKIILSNVMWLCAPLLAAVPSSRKGANTWFSV